MQVKGEGEDGVQNSRKLGEDRDQPFFFTVGDPGSLWGGITCRRRDRRDRVIMGEMRTIWATDGW